MTLSREEQKELFDVVRASSRSRRWTRRPGVSAIMYQIELRKGLPIEQLLNPQASLEDVAKDLGVDFTTVSKWRKRFGLRE